MENVTKRRILCLYRHLLSRTDAEHPLTTGQLIRDMKDEYGIHVNRNTLADDLASLNACGFPVETLRSRGNSYYVKGDVFEPAELKLLIDAVSASKFITQKRSAQTIEKLLSLTNAHRAEKLRRHVIAEGRVKSENEKGYRIADRINEAIDLGRKIRFRYADYSVKKRKVLRHGGEYYVLSPYALVWDGDWYYAVGWGEGRGCVQSFRLDRIYGVPEITDEKAVPPPEGFDAAARTGSVFRMYGSEKPADVELLCEDRVMNAVIDRFGRHVRVKETDPEHFQVTVMVCPSPTFYRWVFGWDGGVRILGPEGVKEEYRAMVRRALEE